MIYQGLLKKMKTDYKSCISYFLEMDNDVLHVNQLVGKSVKISFLSHQCTNCGKAKKIFRQGNCYDCFYANAQVGDWVMRPELSTAHLGIEDRDLDYEKSVQLKPHIVYLAVSSNLKVGVTRKTQVPTRWIDQGASKAIAVLETPNRYLAGAAEVALKEYMSDKTSWQKMLKNNIAEIDLLEEKSKIKDLLSEETKPYFLETNEEVYHFEYPVVQYPTKIKSVNFDKIPDVEGVLKGVKGQYLIFENGQVLNVRNHEGFVVNITVN